MIIDIMNKHTIKKRRFLCIFFLFFLFCSLTRFYADDRDENIDVFLVLDKSLSMEEEIDSVKEYVSDAIVDELLIPGDNFIVIVFYGKAEPLLTLSVTDNKANILSKIGGIDADGRFTDIGNALDALRDSVAERGDDDRRQYLLLITDGIQEAPPDSKYYSKDGTFNHEFLENTKEIVMEGWKIHVLGIGTDTAAEEIAKELSGTFAEVPENPTAQDFKNQTREFLGIIELQDTANVAPVGKNGKSSVSFSARSSGYSNERTVIIAGVRVSAGTQTVDNGLGDQFSFAILPDEEKKVKIPLMLPLDLEPGSYSGRIVFVFAGDTPFTPAAFDVPVRIKSFIQRNIWIFPVGAAVLFALALGIFLISKAATGGSIKFWIEIEDGLTRKRQFKLKAGKKLFISDGVMGLNVVNDRNEDTVAELTAEKGAIRLTVLDEKKLKIADNPVNVLGKELTAVKRNGKKVRIAFTE